MAKSGAVRAGRAYVELFADSSKLVRGLRMSQRRLEAFGRRLKSLGSMMTLGGMAAAGPLAISSKWFADFEDAMLSVRAVSGATDSQFAALTDRARELGRATSYTASQVAGAMLELARAGFAPTEIDAAIGGMLNLARATGTELPMAAEIAAATLRGFGMEATQMSQVADVLVATANNSAQTLEDLGESMKYVAPIASAAGLSLQDTSKALGTLANMGIKGSMAGTSLRMILLKLSNTDVQDKLRAVGVEALDAGGNLRSFGDIMIDIGRAVALMPNAKRINFMRELFDMRAVTSAVKLTTEQFDRLNQGIDEAAGIAAKQALMMDSGVGGAFRRLASAAQDVALSIGQSLAPALSRAAEWLTNAANELSAFIIANQEIIVTIGAVTAGLLVMGPIVTSIGTAFIAAGTAVGAVGTALGLLLTPIGLVSAAFVGLGTVLVSSTEEGKRVWDEFVTSLSDMIKPFAEVMQQTFGGIADALKAGDIQLAMETLTEGIRVELLQMQDMWQSFWDQLVLTAKKNARWISPISNLWISSEDIDNEQKAADKAATDRSNAIADSRRKLDELTAEAEQKRAAEEQRLAEAQAETERQKAEEEAKAAAAAAASAANAPPTAAQAAATDLLSRAGAWLQGRIGDALAIDPKEALFGLGAAIGQAEGAIGGLIGGAAASLSDELPAAARDASRTFGEASGTFSAFGAMRVGAGVLGASPVERAINKVEKHSAQMNKRLDQLVDAARRAQLVFTGGV